MVSKTLLYPLPIDGIVLFALSHISDIDFEYPGLTVHWPTGTANLPHYYIPRRKGFSANPLHDLFLAQARDVGSGKTNLLENLFSVFSQSWCRAQTLSC